MRSRASLACLWAVVTVMAPTTCLAASNDFDFYPSKAQSCLTKAADKANCPHDTMTQLNSCQCSDGGDFVTNTAACLASEDPDDVVAVYAVMEGACANSNTGITLSRQEFVSIASSAAATATTASSTATSTASATSTNADAEPTDDGNDETEDDSPPGLGTSGVIGVAAGCAIAGAGPVALVAWFVLRRYGKRNAAAGGDAAAGQAHPMLDQTGNGSMYNMHDPGVGMGYVGAGGGYYGNGGIKSPSATAVSPMHSTYFSPTATVSSGTGMSYQHPHEYLQQHQMQLERERQQQHGPVELASDGNTMPPVEAPGDYASR